MKQKYQISKVSKRAVIFIVFGISILLLLILAMLNFLNFTHKQQNDMNSQFDSSLSNPKIPIDEENSLKCNNLKRIEGIGLTQPDNLQALESYQKLCDSFVSDHFMIFSPFPSSMEAVDEISQKLSDMIIEFQRFGVVPVIVLEPADEIGYVSLKEIAEGEYQEELQIMFQKIAKSGINLDKETVWIPYPEINTPTWNKQNFSERDFPNMIEGFNLALRANLPRAKVGVLLNAKSYDKNDKDWESGSYESFSPYLEGMENEQVQIFVIQGFPWMPPANQSSQTFLLDASEFLQPKLAIDSAQKLNVDEVWLNTGTFGQMYTDNSRKKQSVGPAFRKKVLSEVVKIASEIQSNGFRTRIHLFADDKSDTKEAIDWSYHWEEDEAEKKILFDLISHIYDENLDFSIFDSGSTNK